MISTQPTIYEQPTVMSFYLIPSILAISLVNPFTNQEPRSLVILSSSPIYQKGPLQNIQVASLAVAISLYRIAYDPLLRRSIITRVLLYFLRSFSQLLKSQTRYYQRRSSTSNGYRSPSFLSRGTFIERHLQLATYQATLPARPGYQYQAATKVLVFSQPG